LYLTVCNRLYILFAVTLNRSHMAWMRVTVCAGSL